MSATLHGLRIFDVATGKRVFEEAGTYGEEAAFEPRSARFATFRRIFFDARGDHVAVQSPDTELVVYSVPAGSTVLRVPKVRDLRAVVFDGSIARALTYAGESQSEVLSAFVTEYDLSTSKQRGRVELDVVMRLDRPGLFSFGLGGGWTLYRSYVLGPRGLFAGKLEKSTFETNRMPWAN